jgi:thiosulfate dehydrogenase
VKHLVFVVGGVVAAAAALSGCSAKEQSAVDHGRELFGSKSALSPSSLNAYACSTCHDETPGLELRKPGAALAGATLRRSFWGGQENDLLESINACRNYFMLANVPLASSDEKAEALFAYLESLEPGSSAPVPFHVVTLVEDLPRGDAGRGLGVYATACSNCHGAIHSGVGRLGTRVSILPDDAVREHAQYTPRVQRLIFIEKIRHGRFLGYGGEMPPFSSELLSDTEVSDVLEYVGALGE